MVIVVIRTRYHYSSVLECAESRCCLARNFVLNTSKSWFTPPVNTAVNVARMNQVSVYKISHKPNNCSENGKQH